MSEQRGRIRAKYDTSIKIITSNKTITSDHTRDISLNGISVITTEKLPLGTQCELELTLNSQVANLTLKLRGDVVREMEDGFAINFNEMDIETYQHLKNIVLYNTEDPESFLQQCQERPGFK